MTATASIYLDGLAEAQAALVTGLNEQFRRHSSGPDDLYQNYIAPNAASFIDETIKRWLDGERIELEQGASPRDLEPRDALLAHLSNPGNGSCEEGELAMALILPGMVERVMTDEQSEQLTVAMGVFFNCRENGLVYTVEQPDGAMRSFSVYEHRNSDSIIINGCTDWDGEQLPYAADSKNGFFAEIACGNYAQAADALTFYLVEAARGELAGAMELVATAEHLDWTAIIAKSIPGFEDWVKKQGGEPMDRLRDQSSPDA